MRVVLVAATAVASVLVSAASSGAACPPSGPCVAILDTGIDPSHPDLAGVTVEFRNFTGSRTDAHDDYGHGTAVASRVAGSGTCAAGLVPNAHLLVGKVNFEDDKASVGFDAIREGIEWATGQGAQVINLSLGGPDAVVGGLGLGENEVEQAIADATAAGVLTVVAVGNTFVLSSELNTPANALEALVVGAASRDGTPKSTPLFLTVDVIGIDSRRDASFSDLDPHVTAVGTSELLMARAAGTDMEGGATPSDPDGSPNPDGVCVRAAGTSFATPWVAGFASRMRSAYGGSETGAGRVAYLTRLVQWSAIDTIYPYPFEGFGFVEDASVTASALAHAAAGTLPPSPEPNDSLREVSDSVRAVY